MILDFRDASLPERIETDICIVGAGAAGITIARSLISSGLRVVLLEAGGREFDPDGQALYSGPVSGRDYYPLDSCRLRYFGGTTNHWNGFCRPLDAMDFESRDWVPDSGWPIAAADLSRHRAQAHDILALGAVEYDPQRWREGAFDFPAWDPARFETVGWRVSTPVRFGSTFFDELDRAENVQVYLHANVTHAALNGAEDRVEALTVTDLAGKIQREYRALTFVLATGGIENARLLLNWHARAGGGFGNDHDLVGRYFMEHPHTDGAGLVIGRNDEAINNASGFEQSFQVPELLSAAAVSAAEQADAKILNASVLPMPTSGTRFLDGARHLHAMWDALKSGAAREVAEELTGIVLNPGGAARAVRSRMTGDEIPAFSLRVISEQAPNPSSRVQLSSTLDELGLYQASLHWQLSEIDKTTIRHAVLTFAMEAGRLGLGRVYIPDWLQEDAPALFPEETMIFGGHHHMGTTRMSNSPTDGVVDANCRVHGLQNLYVAGSSVFPTGGYANPTLTIVELALRLATNLRA